MSLRSIYRLSVCATALSLATSLGGCSGPGAAEAYTGPGWYLEKSYTLVLGGPKVFGGPFTYDKCEEERLKLGPETSPDMLCVNHPGKPKKYGLY
ncbi:hypothetical protein [Reyranella massiliensis]|uniref:hypothetical protein n=1 Tax=Reyranella massiliensis TaxID=445220 RepID=UPI00031EBCF8|nr:hypothetical protein [Reyranella massiliensis]